MTDPVPNLRATPTSDLLAGSHWEISGVGGAAVVRPEAPLPIRFGHDGRVSGSTGINQFTASYSVNATYLTFGPMALTRRAGPPDLSAQEAAIVGALAGACSYRLEGGRLLVDGPSGALELTAIDRAPAPGDPATDPPG